MLIGDFSQWKQSASGATRENNTLHLTISSVNLFDEKLIPNNVQQLDILSKFEVVSTQIPVKNEQKWFTGNINYI